ncbi:hypothetical protein D5R81_00695 [Parashewanella spongiae]|uniref:KfrA N-terminal DNA-binding domain-containing protein n=1 Tax=Parashewanella spongiae TaxID=342950 RepID=A0A3A6UCV6_9GAMM|nr:hypothetical protein [Parashewanella spongiae]MCL1076757.1 hypothetical protein [Parashewanella spongiae]RJY19496.1 hypothetical protein D5R81_00695 [Parashewanella spongiae]
MCAIDQVINAACIISGQNKTPTIALLKSRLGSSVPMPTLIQGLQRFKSMSADERVSLAQHIGSQPTTFTTTNKLSTGSRDTNLELQKLTSQVEQLIAINTELEKRIEKLEVEQEKKYQ